MRYRVAVKILVSYIVASYLVVLFLAAVALSDGQRMGAGEIVWILAAPLMFILDGRQLGREAIVALAIAIAIALPIVWFAFAFFENLRELRHDLCRGICKTCGYDLRATPDQCPECGTVPETRRTAGG